MRLGLIDVPYFEIEECQPLEGARVMWGDAHRHVPLVERALIVVLVRQDAGIQIVGIGEMRMPLQAVHRDTQRRLELTLAPQGFAEPQEHEALRILGELRREGANIVSHG